jgi:hypothetical protein
VALLGRDATQFWRILPYKCLSAVAAIGTFSAVFATAFGSSVDCNERNPLLNTSPVSFIFEATRAGYPCQFPGTPSANPKQVEQITQAQKAQKTMD